LQTRRFLPGLLPIGSRDRPQAAKARSQRATRELEVAFRARDTRGVVRRFVVGLVVAIAAAAAFAVSGSSNRSVAPLGLPKACALLRNADVKAEFGFRFFNEGDRTSANGVPYCVYSGEAPFRGKHYLESLPLAISLPRQCQPLVRGERRVRDFPTAAWSATSPARIGGNVVFTFIGRGVCGALGISGPRLTRNCPCMMSQATILRHLERLARVVWARLPT
jgi:hypothetical protein